LDDSEERLAALMRARVIADPRKFRDYVLDPERSRGKHHIFLGTLGFRPRSTADSWALARLYEEQAQERVVAGEIEYGGAITFGDRYTIVVSVRGVSLRTGWLHKDDVLRLITPFSGFAARNRRG
jgi:hypothetical protein